MTNHLWLLLGVVGFLIAFVKSAFGVGSGVLFVPVMALSIDPKLAVVLTVPTMLITDFATVRTYWRRWHWGVLKPLALATLIGLVVGTQLLMVLPASVVRKVIGATALLFSCTQLIRLVRREAAASAELTLGTRRILAYVVGVMGGVASAVAHSGGILYSFYLLPRLAKVQFVASLALLTLCSDAVKLLSFWQAGALEWSHISANVLLSPLFILGTWLGSKLNDKLSGQWFLTVVTALVMIVGILLIIR